MYTEKQRKSICTKKKDEDDLGKLKKKFKRGFPWSLTTFLTITLFSTYIKLISLQPKLY